MPDLSASPSDETNNLLRLLVMRADNNTLTPSDLNPPFAPNSNSIIVNCLLYASLSCSLLAAVGAMMAKEWLQSFDRTGQTGPLEEQALFRQRKFNGVLEWHLEAVIKFLPNLLLLSVIFFFGGLCLFLFPINTAVAGIVIAFSGIGVVFSGVVIVAGAVSPTCPYQSAASSALRRGCQGLVRSWKFAKGIPIRPAAGRTLEVAQKFWKNIRLWIESPLNKATTVASTVRSWYQGSSGSDDSGGQQTMNQDPTPSSPVLSDSSSSIPSYISRFPSAITRREQAEGEDSTSATPNANARWLPTGVSQAIERVRRLWEGISTKDTLSILHQSPTAVPTKANSEQVLTVQVTGWLLETTSNRGDQISTAQFISSLDRGTCAIVFKDHDDWKRLLNLTLGAFEIWFSQPNKENQEIAELYGLVLCRVLNQYSKEDDKWKGLSEESWQGSDKFANTFWKTLVHASSKYPSNTPEDDERVLQVAVIYTALKVNIDLKEYLWVKSCYLLDEPSDVTTALLGVWAVLAKRIGLREAHIYHAPYTTSFDNISNSQQVFARDLSLALAWSLKAFESVRGDLSSELNAARGYTECLQEARELCRADPHQSSNIQYGLGDLILSYIDTLATLGSTESRLVRLSVEALLTCKTFLSSHPSSSAIPSTQRPELISSAELIDTVVDILLSEFAFATSVSGHLKSRARTFNACVIRILLWIWRNGRNRDFEDCTELFTSSCRIWAALEKEVASSKTESFNNEDKPLTAEDLKGVAEFAEWVRSRTLPDVLDYDKYGQPILRETSHFIIRNADVGINRLYAHFDRRADWEYHWYDFQEDSPSCSRLIYKEDGML